MLEMPLDELVLFHEMLQEKWEKDRKAAEGKGAKK